MADQFLPVIITLIVAVGFSAVLLGFAALVGQRGRHHGATKGDTYETGMPIVTADRPLQSVVVGSGKCLEEFDALQGVLVSSSRA